MRKRNELLVRRARVVAGFAGAGRGTLTTPAAAARLDSLSAWSRRHVPIYPTPRADAR